MIKKYLLVAFLLFPTLAQSAAGIDWEASFMQVEFTAENSAVPPLSCFGFSDRSAEAGACNSYAGTFDHCVWQDLDSLGYSDEENSPKITDCYQQAGDYQVTVQLIDFAGNISTPIVDNFVVQAGSPDANTSVLKTDSDCSDLSLGATGGAAGITDNVCTLTLEVKDQFGNPVTQLQGQTGTLYSEAEFPSDANSGDLNFRTGTKINGSFIPDNAGGALNFTIGNDDLVSTTFDVTAWAPSLRIIGDVLAKNEPFAYDLKFNFPSIDDIGRLDPTNTQVFQFEQYAPQIGFAPWATALLDILTTPQQYVLDVQTPLEITRNLLLPGTGGPNNPFNVFLTVHDLDPTLKITGLNIDPVATLISNASETIISILRVAGDNARTGSGISFSSRVEYDIVDGGIQKIAYPSGAIGAGLRQAASADNVASGLVSTTLIGVSVEGKILGSNDAVVISDPSSFNGVQISDGESLVDIRREVFENAVRITRSLDAKTSNANEVVDFDNSWFNDSNVAYVLDKDVVITNSGATLNLPAGQNTLVIQNGNLIIEDDLDYANNDDSFGFILINDSIEPEPATGNIFLKDDLTQIVGTFFAEGGLISIPESLIVLDTGDVTLADSDNGDPSNSKQLIIQGTMLTHNTLGGGIFQVSSNDYITPWARTSGADEAERLRAVLYDLHFLRTYSAEFDGATPPNQTNTADCFPGSNPFGCYPNNAATVIRYDGKAVKSPPPGYEGASFFAR